MKYFIDTEFIEGFHKPLFGKRRHFIDLISIGIVAEDGRKFYAVSKDFDVKRVWNTWQKKQNTEPPASFWNKEYWLRDNVLTPIYLELSSRETVYSKTYHWQLWKWGLRGLKNLIQWHGKTNNQIAKEIKLFCNPDLFLHNTAEPTLEFYGYYADYDWVLFCSLFGRMIDLPNGFPMYCRDLKQMFDEKYRYYSLEDVKNHPDYPKQNNKHNALDDARWNKQLYKFIVS